MPRKKRQKQPEAPAIEPTALAEPLATLAADLGLKPASQALKQLEPPQAIDTPPEKPKTPADTDLAPSPESNGKHADKVKRPDRTAPEGWMNVDSYVASGLKVNKSHDKTAFAIQFDESRQPSVEEKDLLASKEIKYQPARRQWERHDPQHPGVNGLGVKQVASEIADARIGRVR